MTIKIADASQSIPVYRQSLAINNTGQTCLFLLFKSKTMKLIISEEFQDLYK